MPAQHVAPSQVGAYHLLDFVGAGAEADVFRALGPGGKVVALKLLAQQLRGDPAWERRLERESKACARLRHPNLLRLLETGTDEQHGPYLVTELLEGQTLRELMTQEPLPPPAVCLLTSPILAGLEAMHVAGFVHRDLKPENVMITKDGQVVIVDLGLSWHLSHSRLTEEGCVAGSVPYMAPEQIQGGPITPRCDVWSMGVMLFELITGRRPFQRQLPGEEVAAILAGSCAPLGEQDRRASAGLSALVDDCLAMDPARRPADATALRLRLSQLEDHDPDVTLPTLLLDPRGALEGMAERQFVAWRGRAERAIQSGDSFGALAAIDRALAYEPRRADRLQDLIDRAAQLERAPAAEPSSATRRARPGVRVRVRRWIWALGAALTIGLIGLAVVLGLSLTEKARWILAGGAEPAPPSAAQKRSKAAERAFYRDAAELVRLMGQGARKRISARKRTPKQRAADEAALQVVDGMGDLFSDVASDRERAPGVDVSPDGQEAAAKTLGGLRKLYQAGLIQEKSKKKEQRDKVP